MTVLDGILKIKSQTDEEKQLKREAAAERKNLRLELDQITESLREIAPDTPGLPPTLAQRKEQERIQKQTKEIAATADLVTDEFGNVIPGLTKSGAVAGRELTLKEKADADRAMLDLQKLKEKEAREKLTAQEEARKAFLQQQIDEIRSAWQRVKAIQLLAKLLDVTIQKKVYRLMFLNLDLFVKKGLSNY
jgi:hypothetical protein